MTPDVSNLLSLRDASKHLLGYLVHDWFTNYLNVIETNFSRWQARGIIQNLAEPTELGTRSAAFDFADLDPDMLASLTGLYVYILACHKGANYRLMNRSENKQVLYLRGYDFEGSLYLGGNMAMGFSSVDSSRFNSQLAQLLAPHFRLFKVLSSRDLATETLGLDRYFFDDFDHITQVAQRPFFSLYLSALSWKDGILHLLDRMDHFVVYVSSITESALWELDQLDTDQRRNRVTVIFDEDAIRNKQIELGFQQKMQAEQQQLVWSKTEPLPQLSMEQVREQLSSKFQVTTPDDFKTNIEQHRTRIATSTSPLPPGQRETSLDFQFFPALPPDKLADLREFYAWLQARIEACTGEAGINCLPLFLNHVQLRICMTLMLGEHDQTGRALAAYGAILKATAAHYIKPHSERLERQIELAAYSGVSLLAFGKSNEFADRLAVSRAEFQSLFNQTKAAVDAFFGAVQQLP